MPDTPTHRSHTTPPGEAVEYRQPEEEDGVFDVRLPIATTGEVRNEGDEPLTRSELRGMARQIDEGSVGVFLDHGASDLGGPTQYSATEKVGEWREADLNQREADDEHELVATARLIDPETLPAAARPMMSALAAIKEQVKRGMSLSASIGWRDDESFPGGVDLMEASIVGIGADPRTVSQSVAVARAVAASTDRFDLPAFVEALRDAGMRPLGPPEDPERFDTFEECVDALAEDPDLSREDAEEICGAWEAAKDDQSHDMTETETQSADDADDDTDHEQAAEASDAEAEQREDDGEEDEDEEQQQCPECETSVRDDANFCHECGEPLGERQEDDEDEEEDEDDEDEDEQSADADDGEDRTTDELAERLADLEDELAAIRSGEVAIERPDPGDNEQREADDEGQDEPTEHRDPADKPDWATIN